MECTVMKLLESQSSLSKFGTEFGTCALRRTRIISLLSLAIHMWFLHGLYICLLLFLRGLYNTLLLKSIFKAYICGVILVCSLPDSSAGFTIVLMCAFKSTGPCWPKKEKKQFYDEFLLMLCNFIFEGVLFWSDSRHNDRVDYLFRPTGSTSFPGPK